MNDDVYLSGAIEIVPAISEAEIRALIDSGDFTEVTWQGDRRIGDGYFAGVGKDGMLGIAVVPTVLDNGDGANLGVLIQENPLAEDHTDANLEAELQVILSHFGTAPDGLRRLFEGAIDIETDDSAESLRVDSGKPSRTSEE